jgi:transcriptional regulator with XRE-family HTH domain
MTQEEFAERIGISPNYLSTMERGKVEIGAEILLRIGREFVKSVEWLLTGEGQLLYSQGQRHSWPMTTRDHRQEPRAGARFSRVVGLVIVRSALLAYSAT